MSRALLIWILAALLTVGGCSARQPAAATVAAEAEGEKASDLNRFCRSSDWVDNYPVLKGLVYVGTMFGLCATGLMCLRLWSSEDDTPRVVPTVRPPE